MDDLIYSENCLESAQILAEEAVELFESRGFTLGKWAANKEAVSALSNIKTELLSPSIRDLDLSEEQTPLPSTKTLSCIWDPNADELRIQCIVTPLNMYTRRTMLSQ